MTQRPTSCPFCQTASARLWERRPMSPLGAAGWGGTFAQDELETKHVGEGDETRRAQAFGLELERRVASLAHAQLGRQVVLRQLSRLTAASQELAELEGCRDTLLGKS